jgi:hypothetical protein
MATDVAYALLQKKGLFPCARLLSGVLSPA